jgi:hypothetical protein
MRRPAVDEIKLFEKLQPPPPPDALRMREAARLRLSAATSAPLAHPAKRRITVVALAGATALVAAGTGYGLTATQDGQSRLPSGSRSVLPTTAAGLTAVLGCPGKYITAGTLEKVGGTQAIIQPRASDQLVTVATSTSTVITQPAAGTVSDITDGSRVTVNGAWSGQSLAATQVDIETGLPAPESFGPRPQHPGHVHEVPELQPPTGALPPPVAIGTVANANDGGFTVITRIPMSGVRRVQVTTSNSTKVLTDASTSLSQLALGAEVLAVGTIGQHGVLTASTVTEPAGGQIMIPGSLVRLQPSGCSASAITTAAILASG